jgi:DNA-binding NarL/FixJ family response regulator
MAFRQDMAFRNGAEPPGRLTPRESEVLRLMAEGLSSKEIGERLLVDKWAVGARMDSLYEKLGVRSRLEAIREAARRRLF